MLCNKRNFVSAQPNYVPLKRVVVDARLQLFAADVTVEQVSRNDESAPIEEQAAVYAFVARIDDREIVAELYEKKEAQQEYVDALQKGHGAYLLEQDDKSQDNFIINVGALPAGAECYISISYVSEFWISSTMGKRFVLLFQQPLHRDKIQTREELLHQAVPKRNMFKKGLTPSNSIAK